MVRALDAVVERARCAVDRNDYRECQVPSLAILRHPMPSLAVPSRAVLGWAVPSRAIHDTRPSHTHPCGIQATPNGSRTITSQHSQGPHPGRCEINTILI